MVWREADRAVQRFAQKRPAVLNAAREEAAPVPKVGSDVLLDGLSVHARA